VPARFAGYSETNPIRAQFPFEKEIVASTATTMVDVVYGETIGS